MEITMETRNMTNRKQAASKSRRKSAWRDTRGAVMVEYALLLTFVAIPSVIGLSIAGVQLLKGYIAERDHLLYPTP
jgi:Flp pilus assembly pilin Flp